MNFSEEPASTLRWRGPSGWDHAWVVSQPDVSPIRFECQMDSELPELLRQARHRVIKLGTHERLMPITETLKEHGRNNTIQRVQVGVGVVGVWQFDLPSADSKPAL